MGDEPTDSGVFNHLHTNAELMAESEFGERIVHGSLVFSVATGPRHGEIRGRREKPGRRHGALL